MGEPAGDDLDGVDVEDAGAQAHEKLPGQEELEACGDVEQEGSEDREDGEAYDGPPGAESVGEDPGGQLHHCVDEEVGGDEEAGHGVCEAQLVHEDGGEG